MMKSQIYRKFSLPYLITKSARLVLKHYEQSMSQMDITPLQGGVLFVISELEPVNQTDISEVLFIDKVTLSKMILSLDRKKLIRMVETENRRSKYWGLTPKGLKYLNLIEKVDSKTEKEILSKLTVSKKDVQILMHSLRELLESEI